MLRYRLTFLLLAAPGVAGLGACADEAAIDDQPDLATEDLGSIVRLRRLHKSQYEHAVADLFGVEVPELAALPDHDPTAGHEPTDVTAFEVDIYRRAAQRIAREVGSQVEAEAGCERGDSQCRRRLVAAVGRRLFRRPLGEPTLDSFVALYDAEGIEGLLGAMLQSPSFLYVIERGEPGTDARVPRALTDWEVATRMALFLWRSIPDDALLDAAGRGELREPAGRRAQAERMLADERAQAMIRDELRLWAVAGIDRLDKSDPEFSEPLRVAMAEQFDRFVDETTAQGGLIELLSRPQVPASAALASVYGPAAPADDQWQAFEPPEHRHGLLTLPGFLAVYARADDSSPVYRGLFVREQLLCQHIPAPPPGIMPIVPSLEEAESNRERYEQHALDPACRGCHDQIDGLGFPFESFDGLGRHRTTDGGGPIDVRGELSGTTENSTFDDIDGLVAALVYHPDVHRCWAKDWTERALGEASGLDELVAALAADSRRGAPLRHTIASIVASERFVTVVPPR